ncbi:MAG: archaellin/type IV pilin N-terminal domain-containing protein [Candidatus Altiarchaeota archaeon]
MRTKNKGSTGVGTLIIFIAVILVAAVAAAVLISTAGSLQQRALVTGGQAEEGVSTGAEAVSVMGTDARSGHNLEDIEFLMRLQAGSESMNLNNTVVTVDTAETTQNLDYSGNGGTSSTVNFAVAYVKQGPDYEVGYLSRGDVIKVTFASAENISENQKVRLKVIPRVGQPTIVEFTTPDVMTDQRINLWP